MKTLQEWKNNDFGHLDIRQVVMTKSDMTRKTKQSGLFRILQILQVHIRIKEVADAWKLEVQECLEHRKGRRNIKEPKQGKLEPKTEAVKIG
jgi:hypothetical protein